MLERSETSNHLLPQPGIPRDKVNIFDSPSIATLVSSVNNSQGHEVLFSATVRVQNGLSIRVTAKVVLAKEMAKVGLPVRVDMSRMQMKVTFDEQLMRQYHYKSRGSLKQYRPYYAYSLHVKTYPPCNPSLHLPVLWSSHSIKLFFLSLFLTDGPR